MADTTPLTGMSVLDATAIPCGPVSAPRLTRLLASAFAESHGVHEPNDEHCREAAQISVQLHALGSVSCVGGTIHITPPNKEVDAHVPSPSGVDALVSVVTHVDKSLADKSLAAEVFDMYSSASYQKRKSQRVFPFVVSIYEVRQCLSSWYSYPAGGELPDWAGTNVGVCTHENVYTVIEAGFLERGLAAKVLNILDRTPGTIAFTSTYNLSEEETVTLLKELHNQKLAVELYTALADQGHADAQCALGVMYVQTLAECEKAVEMWTLAAAQGHAKAQCNLGVMYACGRGVPKDEARAVQLYTAAANQVSGRTHMCNLAAAYLSGDSVAPDEVRAAQLYTAVANQGHAEAQYHLATMYTDGRGVALDKRRAMELFVAAANRGHADAQYNLAIMWAAGRDVARDQTCAVELYAAAAAQGHTDAQCHLGAMYDTGRGVARDKTRALELWTAAADQGNVRAQYNLGLVALGMRAKVPESIGALELLRELGIMYDTGRGVARDHTRAVELYTVAADQGDAKAQSNLGFMYEAGRGVIRDEARAVQLYTASAAQGFAKAQCNLADMYAAGCGVAKNEARAVELYTEAAAHGDARAQRNLGFWYEEGLGGVVKDTARAVRLYTAAAGQGDAPAQSCLAVMHANARAKEMIHRRKRIEDQLRQIAEREDMQLEQAKEDARVRADKVEGAQARQAELESLACVRQTAEARAARANAEAEKAERKKLAEAKAAAKAEARAKDPKWQPNERKGNGKKRK